MHAFSAWSLPVTWRRWWSHHSIRHMRKPHGTRKVHSSMFYRTGVIHCRSKFYVAGIGIFDLFSSCGLNLDSISFIYKLDLYSLELYLMCKYELLTSRLSKVIAWQTDTTEIIYHAASRVVNESDYLNRVTLCSWLCFCNDWLRDFMSVYGGIAFVARRYVIEMLPLQSSLLATTTSAVFSVASFVASTHQHRRLSCCSVATRHIYMGAVYRPAGCNNLYSISHTKCAHLSELYRSWRKRCPSPEEKKAKNARLENAGAYSMDKNTSSKVVVWMLLKR